MDRIGTYSKFLALLFLPALSWASFQPVNGSTLNVQNITTTVNTVSTSTVITSTYSINVAVPTHAVTQSGTWTVQPGNTQNTTTWLTSSSNTVVTSTYSLNVNMTNTPAVTQSGTWTVQPGNTQNTTSWLTVSTNTQVQGMTASGGSNANNPLKVGGVGHTTMPIAVSDNQIVDGLRDKYGRDIVMQDCPRDLMISTSVSLSGSTSETVLLSSGAVGIYNDLHLVLVNNTSGTAARIDFRSSGNGTTVDFPVYVPAGDVRGLTTGIAWPQGTTAANWTVQSSASVTDIRIAALFCKCK